MKSIVKLLSLFILIAFLYSCSGLPSDKIIISLDMSKEHDAGYFKPESGDKICIAGNFNDWKTDSLFLEDADGDWIYSVELTNLIKSLDTLEFKFKKTSGDGRVIGNKGWEGIPNRKIRVEELKKENPVLIFNEIYDKKMEIDLTFTVGTCNQQVLGFFKPDQGDKIVVSGSFCAWDENGILMADNDGDGIYTVTFPARIAPEKPVGYKFRIINKRGAVLINSGWETGKNRIFMPQADSLEAPYAEFNNLRRVARFLINTKKWEKQGKFKPLKGDVLQVNLLLDGKESLSNPLVQVKPQLYEIALQIPLSVKKIEWQALKNIKEKLTELKTLEVDLKGKMITVNQDI